PQQRPAPERSAPRLRRRGTCVRASNRPTAAALLRRRRSHGSRRCRTPDRRRRRPGPRRKTRPRTSCTRPPHIRTAPERAQRLSSEPNVDDPSCHALACSHPLRGDRLTMPVSDPLQHPERLLLPAAFFYLGEPLFPADLLSQDSDCFPFDELGCLPRPAAP